VLLLLDYWPLGRVKGLAPAPDQNLSGNLQPGPARQSYGRLLYEKIPLFALAAVSCLLTLWAQQGSGSLMPLAIRPLGPRLANALVAYVAYVVKMFRPFPMAMFYPLAPVPWWQALAAGLVLLAVSAVLLARARRFPYLAVGWLWYLGTLVPVIGLVQVGGQAMADRYTYIPFIGLFIMVAWGLGDQTTRWHLPKAIPALGAAAALAACCWATWVQAGCWRNSETLFIHALKNTGPNYMAYNHLGLYYADQGWLDQAIGMYQSALAASPTYPHAYNNLAIIYARQGKLDEAIENFQKAIQLAPTNPTFRRNLAIAYRSQGQKSPAEAVPPR
jgi:hypothetical protein